MAYTLTDIEAPEFDYDFENNTAVGIRKVRIEPWSSVDEAILDLAGGASVSGTLLTVTNPAKFPGKDHLWLHRVKVKAFTDCLDGDDANNLPDVPTGGELILTYQTPKGDNLSDEDLPTPPTDTFLTVSRTQSLEYVAEDTQGLFWENQSDDHGGGIATERVDIDTRVSSAIAIADIKITWHRVRQPPWNTIRNLMGMVNDDTFLGYEAEQIMFCGVQDQIQFQVDGEHLWSLTYQFNARVPKFDDGAGSLVRGGWNHFPRPDRAAGDPYWQRIYREISSGGRTDQTLLFIPADLTALFSLLAT